MLHCKFPENFTDPMHLMSLTFFISLTGDGLIIPYTLFNSPGQFVPHPKLFFNKRIISIEVFVESDSLCRVKENTCITYTTHPISSKRSRLSTDCITEKVFIFRVFPVVFKEMLKDDIYIYLTIVVRRSVFSSYPSVTEKT